MVVKLIRSTHNFGNSQATVVRPVPVVRVACHKDAFPEGTFRLKVAACPVVALKHPHPVMIAANWKALSRARTGRQRRTAQKIPNPSSNLKILAEALKMGARQKPGPPTRRALLRQTVQLRQKMEVRAMPGPGRVMPPKNLPEIPGARPFCRNQPAQRPHQQYPVPPAQRPAGVPQLRPSEPAAASPRLGSLRCRPRRTAWALV